MTKERRGDTNSVTIHDFIPSEKLMSSTAAKIPDSHAPSTSKRDGFDELNRANGTSMKKYGTKSALD